MPAPVSPSRLVVTTFGARVVRGLRMRVPDDPTLRHVQAAFALLQAVGATYILLQAALIATWQGLDDLPARVRIGANVGAGVLTLAILLTLTRRGHVRWTARAGALVIMAYQLVFAVSFGLRTVPGVIIVAVPMLSGLALTEPPRRTAWWAIAFGGVALFGLLIEPRWSLEIGGVPAAVAAFMAIGFHVLYMLEFRGAMMRSVDEARSAADGLSAVNAELRAAIDERDRLAGRLETAQRLEAMGRVAGGIAHDFNNLLTVIRGYADLLSRSVAEGTPAADDARQLQRALARASRVSQEVLDFARPRAVERTPIDLGEFVRELAPGLGAAVGANHPLLVQSHDGPHLVEADRGQVERLLVNLVLNARDVSPPGAPIAIDVGHRREGDDAQVTLTVRDRGPGVRPDDRDRIFEPFFTTKGTTGGTGLGLATSYALMQQHGGTLRVEDAAGGGAAFVAAFPVARSTRPRPTTSGEHGASVPRGRPLDGTRALVVEDDPGVRAVTLRFLQQAGAEVVAAEDGVEGIDVLRRSVANIEPFQLIVSDLRLPQGSGAEVLRAARKAWPEAALVAMSGFLEDDAIARMAESQELVFLPKPFTAQQLVQAVEAARANLHRG